MHPERLDHRGRLPNTARRFGPDALRLHMYAVVRAVDSGAVVRPLELDAEIQDSTIDIRHSFYFPIVHSAQRQHVAAFGAL